MTDNTDILKYLDLLNPKVKSNVSIVSAEELGKENMLHISRDGGIKVFTPLVSNRTANNEDRSVPRICVAPDLMGCILGYAADLVDFDWQPEDNKLWKGGYYIYAIPYEFALRPGKKLLYDVEFTDEHWLVGYNPANVKYNASKIGKVFYHSVLTIQKDSGLRKRREITMFIEVNGDTPVHFNKEHKLTKGKWKIVVYGLHNVESHQDTPERLSVAQISESEYKEAKKLSADLLSFTEPPSSLW